MKTQTIPQNQTLTATELVVPTSISATELTELNNTLLPASHKAFTDKYFLRTREILEREGLNPYVTAQVFLRKGPGEIYGINEAVSILDKFTNLRNTGAVFAKRDGEKFDPLESVMVLHGKVQDFVELETMYLGVIAAATTRYNEGISDQQILDQVTGRVSKIVAAAQGRPVIYMGARHWDYKLDRALAAAAFAGGASDCSTDIGAKTVGKLGVGTIPHALENIFAYKYGKDRAVVEATLAFDRHMDPKIPRIGLIDFNNKEIDDAIATCQAFKSIGKKLDAVRVDTCGENVAQGAIASWEDPKVKEWQAQGLALPDPKDPDSKYWFGRGVTVTGVYRLRKALDQAGFYDTKIILTSGFGSVDKVKAFTAAEQKLQIKLFDGLGVGGVYNPCWTSTMDIVEVGENYSELQAMSKVGRLYRPNKNLALQLGGLPA